jgi:hypothetical protein
VAPGALQQIARVGLEQRQFCDARAEARRRFHRDGAAEGMADKIDFVRVLWQRRFHHASLIV